MTAPTHDLNVTVIGIPSATGTIRHFRSCEVVARALDDAGQPGRSAARAAVSRDGTFHLHVPAGRYRVGLEVLHPLSYIGAAQPLLAVARWVADRWWPTATEYLADPVIDPHSLTVPDDNSITVDAARAGDTAGRLWIGQDYLWAVLSATVIVAVTAALLLALATTTFWPALIAAGAVVGLGACWATLRRFRAVVRAVTSPTAAVPRHSTVLATAAEFLLGAALLVLVTAAAATTIRGLDGAGADVTTNPLDVGDAVEGVAWHAANTVPLVDIPKAWGWTEPWNTNPDALFSWTIGAVLFTEQAVVALGLAEAITAITSRAIKGAAT